MSLRKIMFIPKDYLERFGDVQWFVPNGFQIFPDCCYVDDGSPIAISPDHPLIVKIGKKRWLKIVLDE